MKVRLLMLLVLIVLFLPALAVSGGLFSKKSANGGEGKKLSVVKKEPAFKDIKFAHKGSAVRPEYYSTLDRLYSALKENPHLRVSIQGYADDEGSRLENMKLSKLRAMNVEEYLIKRGVPTHRVEVGWHGDNMPVASSAQNRRVSITLHNRDILKELPQDLGLTE